VALPVVPVYTHYLCIANAMAVGGGDGGWIKDGWKPKMGVNI